MELSKQDVLYENTNTPLQATIEKALSNLFLCKDFNEVHNTKKKELGWTPSLEEFLKLNTYGAIFFNQHQTGIGFILRFSQGDCVMVACMKEIDAHNFETIETIVVLRGIQQYIQLGIPHLLIECDSQVVVNWILEEKSSLADVDYLIRNIKEWMGKFVTCKIQFYHCFNNNAAHTLA